MFGEVSKPISAAMSEILLSMPKFRTSLKLHLELKYRKIPIFQFSLIINYPVSYEVDKAHKVILGLIFEALGQILPFDRMRKTDT